MDLKRIIAPDVDQIAAGNICMFSAGDFRADHQFFRILLDQNLRRNAGGGFTAERVDDRYAGGVLPFPGGECAVNGDSFPRRNGNLRISEFRFRKRDELFIVEPDFRRRKYAVADFQFIECRDIVRVMGKAFLHSQLHGAVFPCFGERDGILEFQRVPGVWHLLRQGAVKIKRHHGIVPDGIDFVPASRRPVGIFQRDVDIADFLIVQNNGKTQQGILNEFIDQETASSGKCGIEEYLKLFLVRRPVFRGDP